MDYRTRTYLTEVALVIIAVGAMFVVTAIGFPQKWAGAAAATVAIFGVLVAEFQRHWRKRWFLTAFSLFAVLHFIGLTLLLNVVLSGRTRIPFPWWWAESFVEGIVAYMALLYVKAVAQRR